MSFGNSIAFTSPIGILRPALKFQMQQLSREWQWRGQLCTQTLTHHMLPSFLRSGEFLLHIPCWLFFFNLGSFSYTSRAVFIFIWRVSLTHPMLASFVNLWSFSYTSHAVWILFYLASFSYTAHAGFTFLWGVSLTHPMLASFFNLGSFSYTSRAVFIFIWGASLKHPVLA